MNIVAFGMKFVHVAGYGLILKQGEAICIKIISKALPTPKQDYVNSEGFLAEVFHPWVRWEGPGSGFENSSGGGAGAGGAGGVWKSRIRPAQKSGFFQTPFFCEFLKN